EYVYDEHYDCYLCPAGEVLTYSTTTKEGYREYKSPKKICATCPFLAQCTESKDHQKVVTRHIWQEYIEEAEHLRHHKEVKPIYAKRKETIERVFADAKEKHGMRWTTLRGLKKLSMQAMLTFASMNLKKMATWTWSGPKTA
ncbi:transposase, partial [Gottfriedia acidiceleris]